MASIVERLALKETSAPFVVAGVLTGGALGAVLGWGIDQVAGEGIHRRPAADSGQPYTLGEARAGLEDAEAGLWTTRQEVDVAIGDYLDERCRTAIAPYRHGSRLSDVLESDAVTDIVAEPEAPCGNSRRQVRDILRVVAQQDQRIDVAEKSVDIAQSEVIRYEGFKKDDEQFDGWFFGGLLGGTLGFLKGARVRVKIRRRLNEAQAVNSESVAP